MTVTRDFRRLAWDAYSYGLIELQTTFVLRRVTTRQGHLRGMFYVICGLRDSKAPPDVITGVDFDLNSATVRKTMARDIEGATGIGVGQGIDWYAYLNAFCGEAIHAHEEGEPARGPEPLPASAHLIPWRVQPVLPEGVATSIYGEGGSLKTTVAVALAVSVATGVTVIRDYEPRRTGNVLYLDWEAGHEAWNRRLHGICKGAGMPDPLAVPVYHRFQHATLYRDGDTISKLIARHDVELLVIDSVGLAVESNAEGDPSAPVLRLYQTLRQFGVTTLLVDHVSKEWNGRSGASPYGSIYKRNLARMLFEVRRDEDIITLNHTKSNDTPLWLPRALKVTQLDGVISFAPADMTARLAVDNADKVAAFLRANPRSPVEDIVEGTDLPTGSVKTVLFRNGKDKETRRPYAFDRLPGTPVRWEVFEKAVADPEEHVH